MHVLAYRSAHRDDRLKLCDATSDAAPPRPPFPRCRRGSSFGQSLLISMGHCMDTASTSATASRTLALLSPTSASAGAGDASAGAGAGRARAPGHVMGSSGSPPAVSVSATAARALVCKRL